MNEHREYYIKKLQLYQQSSIPEVPYNINEHIGVKINYNNTVLEILRAENIDYYNIIKLIYRY